MLQHPLFALTEACVACLAAGIYGVRDALAPWFVDANTCKVLKSLVLLNGLYDIACAWAILVELAIRRYDYLMSEPAMAFLRALAGLHAGVWNSDSDRNNPLVRRLLAYWIATYGLVRLLYGLSPFPSPSSCGGEQAGAAWLGMAAALTFFVEAFAYASETWRYAAVHIGKSAFVYSTCLVMGAWLLRCHYISCP